MSLDHTAVHGITNSRRSQVINKLEAGAFSYAADWEPSRSGQGFMPAGQTVVYFRQIRSDRLDSIRVEVSMGHYFLSHFIGPTGTRFGSVVVPPVFRGTVDQFLAELKVDIVQSGAALALEFVDEYGSKINPSSGFVHQIDLPNTGKVTRVEWSKRMFTATLAKFYLH